MKKVRFFVVFFAIFSFFGNNTFGQDLYFNFVNNSEYLLHGVHIIPYDVAYDDYAEGYDWSDDLLPSITFDPGVSAPINIPSGYAPELCTFAVKVTYYADDGGFYEKILCYFDACEYTSLLINTDWSCQYEY